MKRVDLVVVARWYPTHDEPGRGAFVAHQVEALERTGRVRPLVLSFEDVLVAGTPDEQHAAAAAVAAWDAQGRALTPPSAALAARAVNGPVAVPVVRARVPRLGATVRAAGDDGPAHAEAAARVVSAWPAVEEPAGRTRPGVVHVHSVHPEGAAGLAVARALGWPLVVTEHASYVEQHLADPAIRGQYLAATAIAGRVIAVSQTLAGRMERAAPELAGRIEVIPNAVPLDLFTAAGPPGRDPDVLLYVGGRRRSKGTATLLGAFAIARRERPSLRLRLIGPSPTGDDEWRAEANRLGVGDAIEWHPSRDRAAIARALTEAALFVHPSPSETFGVVAAEALACGLPVVAADSGGVTEILNPDPERFGAIVPRDDPEALAAGITAALSRRATFDPAVLRSRIAERYDAAVVAARLADLYDEVTEAAGARGVWPLRQPPGAAPPTDRAVVVLGLDRRRLVRAVAALPTPARAQLAVVTVAGPGDLPAGLRSVTEINPEARDGDRSPAGRWPLVHRVLHRIRHPDDDARRGLRRDLRNREAAGALEALAATLPGAPVIAADGQDHLVAEALRTAGTIRPAPGGFRWLADAAGEGDAGAAAAGGREPLSATSVAAG